MSLINISSTRPACIIGAGTLGRRIAVMFSQHERTVNIIDPSVQALHDAKKFIESNAAPSQDGHDGTAFCTSTEGISYLQSLRDGVANAWIVIEAVPENISLKNEIFAQVLDAAPTDCVLATNSSSFAYSEFEAHAQAPSRFLNTHFYQPPEHNHVELMFGDEFPAPLAQDLEEAMRFFGLVPHQVKTDSLGFIFNRLWAAIKRESLQIISEGVGTPADIDDMFKNWFHAKKSPFEMIDAVGLDVVLAIEENYASKNPGLSDKPRKLLQEMIDQGKLGAKSGGGFLG